MKHALLSALMLISVSAHASKALKPISVESLDQTILDQEYCQSDLESKYGKQARYIDSGDVYSASQLCEVYK